jgi:flagellar L-ring protein FlgH
MALSARRRNNWKKYVSVAAVLLASAGCAGPRPETYQTESVPSVTPTASNAASEGSLWQDRGHLSDLFVTYKARRVGDIITVNIVESSSASNNATTKTGRKSAVEGQAEAFFNAEKRYPAAQPFFNPFSKVKGGLDSSFDGSGATARSGKVTAFVAARVVEVLPDGNLKITGSRDVTVNKEKQFITLSGIVRPWDISPENMVLSTHVAEAKITYSGSGVVDDRQHPGWLARVLDRVFPF